MTRNRASRDGKQESPDDDRSRAVIDSAAVGIEQLSLDGRILDVNAKLCALLGRSREDLVARRVADVTHPEDASRELAEADRLIAGEIDSFTIEVRRTRGDGSSVWVLVTSSLSREAIGRSEPCRISIVQEITERKRTHDALKFLTEASEVLASSLDYEITLASVARLAVPRLADWCAVDLLLEGGAIRRVAVVHTNPAMVELGRELVERYPLGLDTPDGFVMRSGESSLLERITDDALRAYARDEEHLRVLRGLHFVSSMVVPLRARERMLGAISLVTAESDRRYDAFDLVLAKDLARRAAVAIDNARLHRDLIKAAQEAEAANRIKDEFLATVSHELRTPLQSMLGWSSFLRTHEVEPAVSARAIEAIERNGHMQARLISDLLDVSRIQSGKLRLDVRIVDLAAIAEAAMDVVRPAATTKGVHLELHAKRPLDPITGDPDRLRQVIWNLLSNAVKFTPSGGKVDLRIERVGPDVVIAVSDTGEGIAPELLPQLFERFRQGSRSTTHSRSGLGLGLAIVRHLVELHGGTVRAASDGPGRGSSFTVHLPVRAVAPRDGDSATATKPSSPSVPSLEGLRLLVVDDESDARDLISTVLRDYGAETTSAESVPQAIEAADRVRPDVLVGDLAMPGEDGLSLVRKMRALANDRGFRLKAVALTAYSGEEDGDRALKAGYDVHVSKPVEPTDLVTIVARLAGR